MKFQKIYINLKRTSVLAILFPLVLCSGCGNEIDVYDVTGAGDASYSVDYQFIGYVTESCIKFKGAAFQTASGAEACRSDGYYKLNGSINIRKDGVKILDGYLYYPEGFTQSVVSFFSVQKNTMYSLECIDKLRLSDVKYGNQHIDCALYKMYDVNATTLSDALELKERNLVLRFGIHR